MGIFNEIKKKLSGLTGEDNSAGSTSARNAAGSRSRAIPETTPEKVYAQMQAGEEVTLLDIRMPWDHQGQHPKGSISMPINELQLRVGELDTGQHYVLSCYHGFSSLDAVKFLLAQGFEKVESMQGGFSGWAAAGLPVEGRYVR